MRVAMLGTGIMGAGMTRNLVGAGHEVRAWNRTRERAEGLGAEVADSPADAVRDAEAVVTMLARGEVVREVVEQAADALEPRTAWAQMSTVGIDLARELGELADRLGLGYVDAPVLGTRQPAEAGELTILASGDRAARERCAPLFEAMGARTIDLGDEAGAGSRFKLVANSWVVALIEGAAETLAFARAVGVDGERVLEAFAGGPLDSGYLQAKGGAMLAGAWEPSFPLALARKDADLVLAAATELGVDLPALRGTAEAFARAEAAGHGEADLAATYRGLTGT
jgi:3-hydroxyisobutyrate dehydrogenase